MSKHTICKLLVIAFLLVGVALKSLGRPVEIDMVIAGEIEKTTGRVTITAGEFKERSFSNIAAAMEEMKSAGYRRQAVEQLRIILESNIEAWEKMDAGKGIKQPLPDTPLIQNPEPAGGKLSLVIVERINERKYGFTVSVGYAHEIAGQYDLDTCEKMNKKCFICPDHKIRCKTMAVIK